MRVGMLRNAWLRLWGGRAAVFALCLQLALSAGHLHSEGQFGPKSSAPQADAFQADRRDAAPTVPLSGPAEDACAICLAMQMVASALPPLLYRLPIPAGPAEILLPAAVHLLPVALTFPPFQPRAPPFH
jgi:hypothetical protein